MLESDLPSTEVGHSFAAVGDSYIWFLVGYPSSTLYVEDRINLDHSYSKCRVVMVCGWGTWRLQAYFPTVNVRMWWPRLNPEISLTSTWQSCYHNRILGCALVIKVILLPSDDKYFTNSMKRSEPFLLNTEWSSTSSTITMSPALQPGFCRHRGQR